MELARHYHPPHPLTQTYRPGILPGPGAGPYMPHSPYISVRIDPTGMPFVDWGLVRLQLEHNMLPFPNDLVNYALLNIVCVVGLHDAL